MIPRPKFLTKPLSMYHPVLYKMAAAFRRLERRLEWCFDSHHYARTKDPETLPFRVKKHQSVLIRKLGGADLELQKNKVHNLKLVINQLNDLLIKPGETF